MEAAAPWKKLFFSLFVWFSSCCSFPRRQGDNLVLVEFPEKEDSLLGFVQQVGGVETPCEFLNSVDSQEFDVVLNIHLFPIYKK